MYVQDPAGVMPHVGFWKRLAGFTKVFIAAGATASVVVSASCMDLAYHNENMVPVIYAGTYRISAGGSSNTDSLLANYTVAAPSFC